MSLSLQIVIAGGGIAALACAVGLARQGHRVLVLESHDKLAEVGSGINIPSNATRVMERFGVLERLKPFATPPKDFVLRRYDDSRALFSLPATKMTQTGLPNWGIGRVDYSRVLYEAAVAAGAEVRFGARVEDVDEDAPSVTLAGGEIVHGDLIVGANGIHSTLRARIIPDESVEPVVSHLSIFRAIVPTAALEADPAVAPLIARQQFQTWLGPRRYVVVYPIENGTQHLIDGLHPRPEAIGGGAGSWDRWRTRGRDGDDAVPAPTAEFAAFDPAMRAMLKHVSAATDWQLAEVPPLPRWVSRSGKVVLVGDAAHAMFPFLGQGAAMAAEDAGALATCLGRVRDRAQLPAALRAFERARKWRAEQVAFKTRRSGETWSLPDGEWRDLIFQGGSLPKEAGGDMEPAAVLDVPFADKNFLAWLYNYDVFAETDKVLDKAGL